MKHKVVQNYVNLRRKAYPRLEEQLDMIFHKGLDAWKEEITKIKSTYPKPKEKV